METPFPAYRGDEPYIFVCYSHEDAAVVFPELSALRDCGVNIYYDEGIAPGHEWTQELADAIDGCSRVLFFVSPSSAASRHCRNEVQYALDRSKSLVSVYLKATGLPGGLQLALGSSQAIMKYELGAEDYERKLSQTFGVSAARRGAAAEAPSNRQYRRKWPIVRWLGYLTVVLTALAAVLFAVARFGPRQDVSNAPAGHGELSPALAADARPAIAVLPFDSLSTDPDQAFFADGLAEDLITRLESWRAFPVIARTSSFQYRGEHVDLAAASKALGARYLVEGSVRRAGARIRVTAQLIDASSGEQVWADSYDGEVADVFALQDEFSGRIAAALVGDLNRAEAERARQRGTGNLEAWSLYQLGLEQADRFNRASFAAARELFEQAMQRDPRFATALAQLTFVNLWEAVMGWSEDPATAIADSLETARRAVALDPRDPAALAALGWAYVMSGDVDNGLQASRRALELNPSQIEAVGWLSWSLLMAGDAEGSIVYAKRARRLNPMGALSSVLYDNLSEAYWQLGDYEAGLRAARHLLADLPDYYFGHVFEAMNLVGLGRLDEARAAIAAGRRAQPELSLELVQGIYGVHRPEIDARRNTALRQAGLR